MISRAIKRKDTEASVMVPVIASRTVRDTYLTSFPLAFCAIGHTEPHMTIRPGIIGAVLGDHTFRECQCRIPEELSEIIIRRALLHTLISIIIIESVIRAIVYTFPSQGIPNCLIGTISPAHLSGIICIVVLRIGRAIKYTFPCSLIPPIFDRSKRTLRLTTTIELWITEVPGSHACEIAHVLVGEGPITVKTWWADINAYP